MAPSEKFLSIDEIRPRVHVACYAQFQEEGLRSYRVLSHHLILIESGWVEWDPPTNRARVRAVAGEMACFRHAGENRYSAAAGSRTFQAQLQFAPAPRSLLTPWLDGVGPMPDRIALGERFEEVRRAFETLCMCLSAPSAAPQLRVRAAVFEILALTAAAAANDPRTEVPQNPDRWQRARMRLETHLRRKVSVNELATSMGMRADRFIREFSQRFGFTPRACRTQAQLQEAVRLIRAGADEHRSVKSVAYAVGFDDPKFFARQFRKYLAAKPSDFRKHGELSATSMAAQSTRRLYLANRLILPPGVDAEWVKTLESRPKAVRRR